jgi:hypothetical protein
MLDPHSTPSQSSGHVQSALSMYREEGRRVTYRSKARIVIPDVPARAVQVDAVDAILATR